jgi:hypothetical protein
MIWDDQKKRGEPGSSGTTAVNSTIGSRGHLEEEDRASSVFFISGPLSSE